MFNAEIQYNIQYGLKDVKDEKDLFKEEN